MIKLKSQNQFKKGVLELESGQLVLYLVLYSKNFFLE